MLFRSGQPAAALSTTDYNFYVQYDWKFLPRVTFNGGLRYEYQQLPEAVNPNPSTDVIPNIGRTLNQATSKLPNDKNNFGPRLGFAIDATGDGKTAIRGGYGLYYGRIINSTVYNALVNTGATGSISQTQVSLPATNAAAPVCMPKSSTTPPSTATSPICAPGCRVACASAATLSSIPRAVRRGCGNRHKPLPPPPSYMAPSSPYTKPQ